MAVQISAQDYYNKFGEAPKRTTASGSQVQMPIKISLKDFESKFSQSAETPIQEPSAYEKIGAFVGGIANFAKEIPGMVLSPVVKTGLSIGELFQPDNYIKKNNIPTDVSVNVFGNEVKSVQRSGYERNTAYAKGDITKEQLAGGALLDTVDIFATILSPLEGILANAGKKLVLDSVKRYGPETFGEIFREGSRILGKQGVDEAIKKGGGKITAETTDIIIKQGMESLGKKGILKGDKLISKAGLTNLIKNPLVAGGAGYGAGYGLATGMQQNQGALDLAKSTAKGTVFGIGGGIALHTLGKIVTGATSKISSSIANKRAGAEAVTEARNTIKAAEELLGHKLGSTETKQITKSVFNGASKDDVIKSIINEADNAKVNLDTDKIVRATDNYFGNSDIQSADIFDVPETTRVSSEIVLAKTPTEIEKLIPDFVPVAERPALIKRLFLVKNPDEVANILDGYNPTAKKEKLATQISKTENEKSIVKMITGIVPEKEVASVAKDFSPMKDPSQIANILDGYKPKTTTEPVIPQNPVEKPVTTKNPVIPEQKTKVQGYTGTGVERERGAARSVREKALASGMDSFDIPTYKQLETKKIFQTKVPDFVDNTPTNEVIDVAMGRASAPDGIPPELVFIDLAKKADLSGDYALLERLSNESSLIEEATTMGQRIQAWSLLNEFSPSKILIDIKKAYMKEGGENARREIIKKTEIMRKELDFKIEDARGILNSLICKT